MSVDLRNASLRLHDTLNNVGVSEEMRRVHRQAVTKEIIGTILSDLRQEQSSCDIYYFGSSSEGSTIPDMGSDIDMVTCSRVLPVVTDLSEAGVAGSLLMTQDAHTFPGYAKLQIVHHGRRVTVYEMEGSEHYEPDMNGRMCRKPIRLPGVPSHGPAIDTPRVSVPCDAVPALQCLSVPDSATRWLRRPRLFGWPSRRSLDRMATLPHFVVGVGHPFSKESNIEWRLSYSLHERELMFSLNHVQHQCYVFLKMTKKNVIEPAVGEESISSYHCKTALFWAIEETPTDMWRPDMLLHCIFTCFWYLKRFVRNINCPNFFNPACNLFEREVFLRLNARLSSVLKLIMRCIPEVVTLIKCGHVGENFLTGYVREQVVKQTIDQRCFCLIDTMSALQILNKQLSQFSHERTSFQAREQNLYRLLQYWSNVRCITEHTEEQTEEARQFMLPSVHFRLATCLAAEGLKFNKGPVRNQLLRSSAQHLRWSRDRDLMTSRLISVAVMYKLGYLGHCERMLQDIESELKPYVMSHCSCSPQTMLLSADYFWQWVSSEKPSLRYVMVSAFTTCATFLPSERELIPEPLLHELDRSLDFRDIPSKDEEGHNIYDWVSVDGKVYLYLMQYLVFSQLNKPNHKQVAIDNLKWVINNDPNLSHKDTAYNVLGWIYSQEGAYREAQRCWRVSFDIRPFHNAASRHFPDLINNPVVV